MSGDYDASDAWLQAITDASACLRTDSYHVGIDTMIDASFVLLGSMESILYAYENHWDDPPTVFPPSNGMPIHNVVPAHDSAVRPSATRPALNGNRFAGIQYDTDSSDDDDGGDVPVLNRNPFPPKTVAMSMRRLMIRIVTVQSEILAKKGGLCRYPEPRWVEGAEFYFISLFKIQGALALADSEISRLMEINARHCAHLEEDAQIVGIALGRLTTECHAFQRAAEQLKARLIDLLNPQWASRDIVKKAMGGRWTNNPNPHNRESSMRKLNEEQLREIEEALIKMSEMETEKAEEDVKRLKTRLQVRNNRNGRTSKIQRNNGLRPTDITGRVALELYPDPTTFGWTFTGSHEFVEFFEKGEIKLDWYFTTATVKTSMDHPRHGRTQMFASTVTPALFVKILLNPRAHTKVRYRTRANKPRSK